MNEERVQISTEKQSQKKNCMTLKQRSHQNMEVSL